MRTEIMTIAKQRAEYFKINNILVATNTGQSIRAAYQVFGAQYRFFAVGNPSSAHEHGLVSHSGITPRVKRDLQNMGITVVLQDQSMFQFDHIRSFYGVPYNEVRQYCSPDGHFNADSFLYNTLQLFGDGPRVCLEITLMAADAGVLPLDVDCLAVACPSSYCDLPDAALVLHPAKTAELFVGNLRIKDVTLCPTSADVWFTQRPLP